MVRIISHCLFPNVAEKCPDDKKALVCKHDGFVDDNCKCKCTDLFVGDTCEKLYSPGK